MVNQAMIEYMKRFIEERDPVATDLRHRFPFRKRAEHCYRVYKWAQRINEQECGDPDVVEISALFHDIGKCVDNTKTGHGKEGSKICRQYLSSIEYPPQKIAPIANIIRHHSFHEKADTIEAQIVSDADLLDEVGALTVLWDGMAVGGEDEQSYAIAYKRILKAYSNLSRTLYDQLHTDTGRHLLKERMAFLRMFLENLEFELGIVEPYWRDDGHIDLGA